jgi:hypothetical protein
MTQTNGTEKLTELERVLMENYALKNSLMQQQLQANLAARAAFIQRIEDARPGYRWSDQQGLIPIEPQTGE